MELEHGHGHGVKLIQDGYKWRIVLAYDGTQYAGFPLCSFHFIYKVLTFLKNSHLGRTLSTYLYPGFVVSLGSSTYLCGIDFEIVFVCVFAR